MANTVFDLNKSKTTLFSLSSFLALKKSKNTPPPPLVAGSKIFFNKFSKVMRQVKATSSVKFWNWGPPTIWHNLESVKKIQNHSTLQYCAG